jgi:MATE family multidrug resistance protein
MVARMTLSNTNIAVGAPAPRTEGLWRAEFIGTIKLALPIALTQLGQIAMMTSDLMLIGHLGDKAIAAAALGQMVLFAGFMLGMGLVSAVAPLAAQACGAREPRMVRRALRVGLWVSIMAGLPLMALQHAGESALLALGQEQEAARLAAQYLLPLSWSMIPAWWFIALRGFMSAVNRPEPAL